jgi:hypothetical protein
MTDYVLHGVVVASSIPLPALPAPSGSTPALHLAARRSNVAGPVAGEVFASSDAPGATYTARRGDFGLSCSYGALGSVSFDADSRAFVSAEAADLETEQALFSGSALALWLVARSELVLHASAVAWDDCAVAILGESNAGKTTLAAQCVLAGARLVGDDVLRVTHTEGEARWHAGVRWLRLRSASSTLTESWPGPRYKSERDGRWVVTPDENSLPSSGKLHALLLPKLEPSATELSLSRVSAAEALRRLVQAPRVRGLVAADLLRKQLELNAELARSVPCFEVTTPVGPPFLGPDAARLRSDVLASVKADP